MIWETWFFALVLFKTMRGELTLNCDEIEILAKALQPFPEKFRGLQDPDLRYRNRHIDLSVNDETKKFFSTFICYK